MQSQITNPPPQSRLLALPKELRTIIYELVFAGTEIKVPPSARAMPSLLQVNQQLASEANKCYYKHSQFSVELDGEQSALEHFALKSGRENLSQIRHFAITCRLSATLQAEDRYSVRRHIPKYYTLLEGILEVKRNCAKQIANLIAAGVSPSALTITYPGVDEDTPRPLRIENMMFERLQHPVSVCLCSNSQSYTEVVSAITWIRSA